ncbi:Hypothetical Protein FCC1311_048482 [Hondaea fermentalgiana]|uniref:Uncharacterized protein n=1 Tax=Hondaea fermentalgiana TaxID=2315210 RepID=A0A2R5GCB8_9STRA|nr:Hypothetical Protein FCC1311_048482 [Hondaea fermentalgiana]|eukprot:GBG28627.1 Hypothetical Protein FCC1311_048482 [Hondaea fermentalgiana]
MPETQNPPPEHVRKMTELLTAELNQMRAQLKAATEHKAQLEEERKAYEDNLAREREKYEKDISQESEKYASLQQQAELYKSQVAEMNAAKREKYQELINNNVKPFFETVQKSVPDKQVAASLQAYNDRLNETLNNEIIGKDDDMQMHAICAMASAHMSQSSKLEELFSSNAEWEKKMAEKEAEYKKMNEEITSKSAEKDKALEALQKELEAIRGKLTEQSGKISDVESHFESEEKQAMPEVTATASSASSGYSSLFDTSVLSGDWRNMCRADTQEFISSTSRD